VLIAERNAMTFGTTNGKPWIEALPDDEGERFTGRTFSRFHIVGGHRSVPHVAEIWATADHSVEAHAHDSDELLYVLSGSIEVSGQVIGSNEVVFIPRGTAYAARVISDDGSRVLRIELPNGRNASSTQYQGRIWRGPLSDNGTPLLKR
jgi:mannose-6-phosphate isomerase-like protein (cupin superfamily)